MNSNLSHMELHSRAKGLAVVCQVCFHATAHVQNGYLMITGRHGSQVHSNLLTADDLRALADLVEESSLKQRKGGRIAANKVA